MILQKRYRVHFTPSVGARIFKDVQYVTRWLGVNFAFCGLTLHVCRVWALPDDDLQSPGPNAAPEQPEQDTGPTADGMASEFKVHQPVRVRVLSSKLLPPLVRFPCPTITQPLRESVYSLLRITHNTPPFDPSLTDVSAQEFLVGSPLQNTYTNKC